MVTKLKAYSDKINAFENADELLKVSKDYVGEALKHTRKDNFVEFGRGTVSFKVGNRGYIADVVVGIKKDNTAVLYDMVNIKYKKIVADTTDTPKMRRKIVSTTTNNSISNKTEKVNTFDKNLDKNTQNNYNSTENKRFSLQVGEERIDVNGEETDKLVALHNLSEESFIKLIELGGFPMPSIAITKPSIPHNDFGDITVVFGKDSISPTDRRNKVYSRDAWTPSFPRVDVLLNSGKVESLSKSLYALVGDNKEYRKEIRRFFDNYLNYTGEY